MQYSIFLVLLCSYMAFGGILYPHDSETRQTISLDGLWDFAFDDSNGFLRYHYGNRYGRSLLDVDELDIELMAVPSSYNDIGTDAKMRDHVGIVWYRRKFFVPKSWKSQRVWIRFSSVCYAAEIWINGESAASHAIGHLPFQAEVTSLLNYGKENNITVSVDNTLTQTTIPQGSLQTLSSGRVKQTYTFDFFNYAGIDRPVVLYTTPKIYIDDITVHTDIQGTTGIVDYDIVLGGNGEVTTKVTLLDDEGTSVGTSSGTTGKITVENAKLWWPYLMDPNPGYLYTLQVEIYDADSNLIDQYSQTVGIRTITWNSTNVLINGKKIYLRGFGKHEDSDIRGKGHDFPLILRDFNLIKWIGANSFRTSHYPYSEEIMDMADRLGIMVIDECPAVNTENFSPELLKNHKQSLTELIQRDKNRPSVIMWSAANEPRTQYNESEDYYRVIMKHIKDLDPSRPTTIVIANSPSSDYAGQFCDVLSFNYYAAWYSNPGDLDIITTEVKSWAQEWRDKLNKPVIITEYGADTYEGLHFVPSFIWSEEYQNRLLSKHFMVFDELRGADWFVGEMIWNFADFKTDQSTTRVGGNKKGIFTRNRQPKSSAFLLRRRYWKLAKKLDQFKKLPEDLDDYVLSEEYQIKSEL